MSKKNKGKSKQEDDTSFSSMCYRMMDLRVFLPYVINQCGSLMFYMLLGQEPLSVAVPVVNGLTFLFTAITSFFYFDEKVKSPLLFTIGIIFVLCGIALVSCADIT